MAETDQITLPITGMTCANCVATVERSLKKVNGVQQAVVNLSSERATVDYDPAQAGLPEMIGRIERAGYGVASGEADLAIRQISADVDALRLEKALAAKQGVLSAQVNVVTNHARVRYIPTLVSQLDLRRTVENAGFQTIETGLESEDAEAKARQAEIDTQFRLLIIGLVFTLPLFLFSMAKDLGILGMWAHEPWTRWMMLVVALPVQFYVGWQYYVGAFKSLRNGSANMDVLVAMGSSACLPIFSLPITFGWLSGHVYFETAAVIITLIMLGKYLEVRAKGRTSEAIKKLMGLRSKTARMVRAGVELEVPVDEVRSGDVVMVRPGEKVAGGWGHHRRALAAG